jgi:hypothetical protein
MSILKQVFAPLKLIKKFLIFDMNGKTNSDENV